MDHSTNRPDDDLFTRLGNGLTRWVLGWGFLTFHATIFTISMIAMVLWNFYDSPNDIWVDEVFRRWGAVLTFHAIVVAAGLTAWRLIRAEQQALQGDDVQWQSPAQPVSQALSAQTAPLGWTQPGTPDVPAAPSPARRTLVALQSADAAFGRALADSATWTSNIARRTGHAASSGASNLAARIRRTPASVTPDPIQTWPVSPVQHRPEDEEFISRFGGNGQPPAGANGAGVDLVLDASGYAPDTDRRSGMTPVTKDPAQSWVQAATYSWHLPRTPADPVDVAMSQNGHVASRTDTFPKPEH